MVGANSDGCVKISCPRIQNIIGAENQRMTDDGHTVATTVEIIFSHNLRHHHIFFTIVLLDPPLS
jgi:hypothetical protein